jgi:hypothetical protein
VNAWRIQLVEAWIAIQSGFVAGLIDRRRIVRDIGIIACAGRRLFDRPPGTSGILAGRTFDVAFGFARGSFGRSGHTARLGARKLPSVSAAAAYAGAAAGDRVPQKRQGVV